MSCDPNIFTVHCPLLGKQHHIKISGLLTHLFLDIFGQFGRNLGDKAIGQNSNF